MRVLIAEDERELNAVIAKRLADEDYATDSVYDGRTALEYLRATDYDVVLLDVMMPHMDGFEVLRKYREEGGSSPVLFLTARDSISDRVTGLDGGADDYLVKPFSFQELLARMRVISRRRGTVRSSVLRVGDLMLDVASHKASRGGKNIELSSREFSILEYLMRNADIVLSRESIREHAWSWDYDGESNVIDVYIRYLRRKIDDGYDEKLIHTIRGSGYMIGRGNV
ncbi:MAG: response regulator transcription factor [Spirochaetes bacterium]|uniref:Response regulator transcription factor n=1 Tax=Candidatus Ornithospirochaeta stercoripullorum TaxID=2840899 RepID=A0A9D9DXJ7_9SPIO|nr:response regulator transcription factor [Candidatus Ornithospirochaeta stercoripullorum]